MKLHRLSILFLPVALLADSSISTTPLTERQADAIVAAEMAEKESKRQAETPDFQVLQRRVVHFGNGRSLTLDKVSKPDLTPRTDTKPTPLTPDQVKRLDAMEQGTYKPLSLSVWVYDDEISLIRWNTNDGQRFAAWTRTNLNLARTVREFAEGSTTYGLAMMIQNESTDDLDERQKLAKQQGLKLKLPEIPNLPKSENGISEYFVEADSEAVFENDEAFEGLDALMGYLDRNKADLEIQLANQEALSAAKKRYKAQNPSPKNSTIKYWVNPQ